MKPVEPRHPNLASYFLLFCFALVVRGLAGYVGFDSLKSDPDNYAELSEQLSSHGVYGFEHNGNEPTPTAFRPPLYPMLLSLLVIDGKLSLVGVGLLHVAIGIATSLITYSIGCRLSLRFAWLGATLVVLDPILIRQGQQVMTESLATLTSVAAWRVWLVVWPMSAAIRGDLSCSMHDRRRPFQWVALGALAVTFGLSILVRPTAAPWAALCVGAIVCILNDCWKRRLADALFVFALMAATLMPWVLRNLEHFGAPIWATTHGGYTLLLANNPSLYTHFTEHGPSRNWDDQDFQAAWRKAYLEPTQTTLQAEFWHTSLDSKVSSDQATQTTSSPSPSRVSPQQQEMELDRLAYELAFRTIADNPKIFAISSLYRVGWLWALWPNSSSPKGNTVVGIWYGIVFPLAFAGCVVAWKEKSLFPWMPALLLGLSLTLVHAVFWSNMRMRAPVVPSVCLLAALGAQQLRRLASD